MTTVYTLALLSGLFQALGYLIYIRKSLRKEVTPNPSTWLMFAYGTATLTLLEWDRSANWMILILPVTCALLSIRVATICFSQGKLSVPKEWGDRIAFVMDVLLTVAYISVWVASQQEVVTEEQRQELVLWFLVLTNVSTLVSFIPLLGGVLRDPSTEHPWPWIVWATAYSMLGYVTFSQYGLCSVFMLYPASNIVLHGSVGLLALRRFGR